MATFCCVWCVVVSPFIKIGLALDALARISWALEIYSGLASPLTVLQETLGGSPLGKLDSVSETSVRHFAPTCRSTLVLLPSYGGRPLVPASPTSFLQSLLQSLFPLHSHLSPRPGVEVNYEPPLLRPPDDRAPLSATRSPYPEGNCSLWLPFNKR